MIKSLMDHARFRFDETRLSSRTSTKTGDKISLVKKKDNVPYGIDFIELEQAQRQLPTENSISIVDKGICQWGATQLSLLRLLEEVKASENLSIPEGCFNFDKTKLLSKLIIYVNFRCWCFAQLHFTSDKRYGGELPSAQGLVRHWVELPYMDSNLIGPVIMRIYTRLFLREHLVRIRKFTTFVQHLKSVCGLETTTVDGNMKLMVTNARCIRNNL